MFQRFTQTQQDSAPGNKRAAEVLALGEIFRGFGGESVARETLAANGDAADFHKRISGRINTCSSFDRAMGCEFLRIDMSRYSLTSLVLGMSRMPRQPAPPPGHPDTVAHSYEESRSTCFEEEIASHIVRSSGVANPGGTPIPWAILSRDFTAGVASEAGNLADAAPRPLEYLRDPLRAGLALGRLGALITPGFRSNFSVPRFTSDVSAGFVSEVGSLTESQPGTGLVDFNSKRLGGYVEVSINTLMQGGDVVEGWLTRCLRVIAMTQLEWGAINANGAGVNPLGLRSTPGIGSVVGGTNGALFNWGHLVDLENIPALANAPESEYAGYLTNTKVRKLCKTTQRATGLPFMWDGGTERPLNGHRAAITSNVPSTLTKGSSSGVCSSVVYSSDWSTLLVPIFGAPDIVVDRSTIAVNGLVRIAINVWAAAGLLQPASFSVMDDALTA
jgi:Phage capsid family